MTLALMVASIFPALMIAAAVSDFFTFTIPNIITILLVVAFIALAPLAGLSQAEMAWHGAAAALMLVAGFAFFAAGWTGGGDAKLCAAISLWLGWDLLGGFILLAAIFGGALALMLILARVFPVYLAAPSWIVRLCNRDMGVPYGVALAAAALHTYSQSFWLPRLLQGLYS